MLVALTVFVYLSITWSILRFFQVICRLDQRMRIISNAHFEKRTSPTA